MRSKLMPHPEKPWVVYMVDPEDPLVGLRDTDLALVNVHVANQCAGEACIIHNPTDHHMRSWELNWRSDTGMLERLCSHGIGHPDPDVTAFRKRLGISGVHGCDGCCAPPDGADVDN